MSFVNPAPGGTEGRTDQGVDWSNISGGILAVAKGTITNVYQNLSGFGTTIVERIRGGGPPVYYALETGGTNVAVRPGQDVQQGQQIATGRGSGVIEAGYWDAAAGRSLGAPGYTEGKPTQAGQAFRAQIGRSRAQVNPPITRPGGDTGGGGGDPKSLLSAYTSLRDMPRTAPPSEKNPVKWFLASFTGKWDNFSNAAGGGGGAAGVPASPPSTGAQGAVTPSILQQLIGKWGWTQQEIDPWLSTIKQESGGNLHAVNKQTGAFGIGQMLAPGGSPTNLAPNMAKYRAYGGDPTTLLGQLIGMGGYIHSTYGTPTAAWAHEQQYGWY